MILFLLTKPMDKTHISTTDPCSEPQKIHITIPWVGSNFIPGSAHTGRVGVSIGRRLGRTLVKLSPLGIHLCTFSDFIIPSSSGNGLSFYFEVNGHAIFMKGSNWIPADILPDRGGDRRRIKRLLTAAKDAHMNMLRVWGNVAKLWVSSVDTARYF